MSDIYKLRLNGNTLCSRQTRQFVHKYKSFKWVLSGRWNQGSGNSGATATYMEWDELGIAFDDDTVRYGPTYWTFDSYTLDGTPWSSAERMPPVLLSGTWGTEASKFDASNFVELTVYFHTADNSAILPTRVGLISANNQNEYQSSTPLDFKLYGLNEDTNEYELLIDVNAANVNKSSTTETLVSSGFTYHYSTITDTLPLSYEYIKWDKWDRVTYTDTSWQSTLVKDQSNNGTVTISTASQFVNFGNNVTSFYTSNSLSSLTVNITRHFKFNDITSLTSAQEVYTNLSSSGVKANTNANGFMLIDTVNMKMTINGNGHILSGLYCTSNGGNAGSFIRGGSDNGVLTFNDFTFDRCLFRSNGQASSGFSMINVGTSLTTYFVNFNKCAIVSESTSSYQAVMFGFLNNNSSTTYNHTQTSFFKCGFKGSRSWGDYSCGDGGISNWSSSPRFNSKWTDSTYIEPVKLGGNGTMYLLAGNRANLTQTGTNTYYNIGTGITAQGTSVNSVETAISTFNNTTLAVSRPNFALVLSNDNLYHKVEI